MRKEAKYALTLLSSFIVGVVVTIPSMFTELFLVDQLPIEVYVLLLLSPRDELMVTMLSAWIVSVIAPLTEETLRVARARDRSLIESASEWFQEKKRKYEFCMSLISLSG